MVGRGQPVEAGPDRRLAEDQPDPRRRRAGPVVAVGGAAVAERADRGRAGDRQDGRGRALAERSQVLAEARLHRPERAALEALDESPHRAECVLEREPRVPLAPLARGRQADVAAGDPQGSAAARGADEPARRQERVQEGQAERRQDVGRAQVGLDPFHDRGHRDELAGRVQVEQLVDQGRRTLDDREAVARPRPCRLEIGLGGRAGHVVGFERGLALFRAAPLVAADRAAVVAQDRARRPVVVGRPRELVGDEHPATGRAAGREQVADRHLEARLPARGGGHALERGVEVAHVRRPQHDLGEHPRQRRRFDRDRAALAIEGGPGHPAAAAGEIDDDVAGPGMRLDPGGEQRRRRGGREPLEGGQGVARFGAGGGDTAGHGLDDASPRPRRGGHAASTGGHLSP